MVLGVALFASYAYFYQAGGWNQNARFALVRAILERHTLQIDAYQSHTGDKALWQGHYYSDKAPGASLLALGPVAVARGISRLAHVDPEGYAGIAWTSYVATVVVSGLFTVVAALRFDGLGAPAVFDGPIDNPTFLAYVDQILVPTPDVGLRFRARDSGSLAMMVERVLTDEELRDRLVTEASEHVLRFDWADIARQTAAVYEQVLVTPTGTSAAPRASG